MNSATVIDSDLNRVITVLSEVTSSISCHWLAGRFPLTFQLRHQSSSNLWAKCKKTEEVQRFFELNLEYLPHSIPRQMSAQPYLNVGAVKLVWCALISQTRSSKTASFKSAALLALFLFRQQYCLINLSLASDTMMNWVQAFFWWKAWIAAEVCSSSVFDNKWKQSVFNCCHLVGWVRELI